MYCLQPLLHQASIEKNSTLLTAVRNCIVWLCLGIKPSFVSRVSNAIVLQQSSQVQFGRQLLRQQMLLYGRVARAPSIDPLRKLTFDPGGLKPTIAQFVRRVGGPRNEWAVMLAKESWKMNVNVNQVVHTGPEWRRAVYQYCMR